MRKFQFAAVLAFGFLLFGGASLARAQEVDKVTVSFPFEVGAVLMPAGAYEVSADSMDPGVLMIKSADGRFSAFAMVISEDPTDRTGDCQFEFIRVGNRYYLSRIDDGTGDVQNLVLPAGLMTQLRAKPGKLEPQK